MPATTAGWTALAAVSAAGTGIYMAVESRSQAKAAKSEAKKQRMQQEAQFGRQLEAGEYYAELSKEQMELQSQMSNINTLANILAERGRPTEPQVVTLPPAKTYKPAERINQAIDDFIKGFG